MDLKDLLERVILPKKGRLSEADKERAYPEEFVKTRHQHSAVERAINALEVHGLGKRRYYSIKRFKRYVALTVLARNIQKLGAIKRPIESITLAIVKTKEQIKKDGTLRSNSQRERLHNEILKGRMARACE